MGCSASIACYPAKIPHFFESLKILAFYTILFTTSLIVCESLIRGLLIGFKSVAMRQALASIDGLNGRRPTLRVGILILDRIPRSCSCGLFPWVALLSAKKYGTPHFSVRKRTSKYSRSLAELLCF
jgi:hypothetical protein